MDNFYTESRRKLRIRGSFDVLVAGSGPAGFGAAMGAARMGMKTLIVERNGEIGGMSTSGLMSHFTGNADCKLYREVLERQRSLEKEADVRPTCINPEILKRIYLEMLREAGAEILFYTSVSDAICTDGRVKGVIVESKSGREAVFAERIVDGTGDGDVAAKAGGEYFIGREDDGKMQPATLMFKVGGVDYAKACFPSSFETLVDTDKGELQALARRHLTFPMGHVLLYKTSLPGVVTCNMTNCLDVDGSKTEDLTAAGIECRLQICEIVDFLRSYAPGYENCYLISSASMIGIRETRHFVGEKVLTEQDILSARTFDDWIVKGAYFNFDVHNMSGAGLDETGAQKEFRQKQGYTIPYGCLIPKGLENLFLSGRNISGSHLAHSNFRAMPICMATGYAAGIAAALSVKRKVGIREVDVCEIQEKLYNL